MTYGSYVINNVTSTGTNRRVLSPSLRNTRQMQDLQVSSNHGRKRKCDPHDYRALLQEDLDKHKSKTMGEIGIKRQADVVLADDAGRRKVPRLLGPILGERFKAIQPRVSTRL